MSFCWDSLELAIYVDAPLDVVDWHWATEAGITRWFIVEAAFKAPDAGEVRSPTDRVQPGDRYVWTWNNGTEERGVFEVCEPERRYVFSFGGTTQVEVTLSDVGGRTLVALTQQTEATDEDRFEVYRDCLQGWTFYLANLKSMMEGGIDLRETAPDRSGLVNV
ncbi:MAG TPA: SRPBCC domain-containing protein [Fimbriimonadaceae bacterium]|nr:SRPBCC domain-containing protein [Fimbriimonadaceae bacterium]